MVCTHRAAEEQRDKLEASKRTSEQRAQAAEAEAITLRGRLDAKAKVVVGGSD